MRLSATIFALLFPLTAVAQYSMVKEYAGSTFFDDWNFYGHVDNLTHGNTNFLSAKDASKQQLAFVNANGNAIIKVDNSSTLKFPNNRDSIRINTKDRFTIGSVWVVDMLHIPYGCSVWPAFWSSALSWPEGGEIDTMEAVNKDTMAHMGLHSDPGCIHSNTSLQTSSLINSTDCSIFANSNQGCITTAPTTKSFGADFASAGGGVWVTEFAQNGIAIWFFSRSDVPQALQGNASTIDTSALGRPTANYSSDGCAITSFFEPQTIIFNIALCGDYAGSSNSFYPLCTGVCYQDWVLGNPSVYDTAYFEVQHLRVYGIPGGFTVISSGASRLLSVSPSFLVFFTSALAFLLSVWV